jgi:hypothetical protein
MKMALNRCKRCEKIWTDRFKSKICEDCKLPRRPKDRYGFLNKKSKDWLVRYFKERENKLSEKNKDMVRNIILQKVKTKYNIKFEEE